MLHLITAQLFALVAAVFLHAYVAKNGLGRIHKIFSALVLLGVAAALICSTFCCCHRGCGGQGGREGCAMIHGSGCGGHDGGMKCCAMGGHEGCMHGEGGAGHGGMKSCHHMSGDSMVEVEKTVIMKDGDSTVIETHRN